MQPFLFELPGKRAVVVVIAQYDLISAEDAFGVESLCKMIAQGHMFQPKDFFKPDIDIFGSGDVQVWTGSDAILHAREFIATWWQENWKC